MGELPQLDKQYPQKTMVNSHLMLRNPKVSANIKNNTGIFHHFFSIILEVLANAVKQLKEIYLYRLKRKLNYYLQTT